MPGNWRKGFSKDQVVQRVRPEQTDGELNNPHRGLVTFQRFAGDPLMLYLFDKARSTWGAPPGAEAMEAEGAQYFIDGRPAPGSILPIGPMPDETSYLPCRVAYCRWAWRLLEPERGRVRFDIIDRALETAASRGQTLQLRTQPFIGPGLYRVPEWYWKTGAASDPAASRPDYPAPDHNDPRYLECWGEHIRALGVRYDGDERLESFDLSYGGGCGEGGGNSTPDTAARLAEIYMDAFRRTPLLIQLGTEGGRHASELRQGRIGWRADCLGDVHMEGNGVVPDGLNWNHMNDIYPAEVARAGVVDAWRHAPVSWESGWSVAYWRARGWDIDWILDQALKYHPSTLNVKSMHIPADWIGRFRAFCRRLGYRFHLQQMLLPLESRPGRECEVSAVIDNQGVAPIYRPYSFALRFSQGDTHRIVRLTQDIRTWLPNLTWFSERFVFPSGLVPGEAKVSCSIVDASDKPVVRLAIKSVDADGWHRLTSIDVV